MSLTSLATAHYPLHHMQDKEALEALRSCLLAGQVRLPLMGEPGTCEYYVFCILCMCWDKPSSSYH